MFPTKMEVNIGLSSVDISMLILFCRIRIPFITSTIIHLVLKSFLRNRHVSLYVLHFVL
jgi:hypothetical protein